MTKEEYWNLTPAETYTKVKGYIYNRDVMSANFRALFTLIYHQYAKHPMSPERLWPLSIDRVKNEITAEEMYERNRKIIEALNKN